MKTKKVTHCTVCDNLIRECNCDHVEPMLDFDESDGCVEGICSGRLQVNYLEDL